MAQTKNNSNVIKYKRTRFNIGSVLFVIILLYIAFISIHYLSKDHISIYEVSEKHIYDDNHVVGLALRSEDVYMADSSGYVGFYNGNKSKVSNHSTIFSIDKTGNYKDEFVNTTGKDKVSSESISNIRNEISSFKNEFTYSDYSQVNDFIYGIESSMLSVISDKLVSQLNSGSSDSFNLYKSRTSGIITYWTDGLEGVTPENIIKDYFNEENYTKNMLKTSDSVSAGDNVCKIVNNEQWNIIIPLDEKQYSKMLDNDNGVVKIRFEKDNLEMSVNFTLFKMEDTNYANLSLNKYMSRYLDDRYINIELILNSAEGLKIPTSSVLEKNCYIVPAKYLIKGGEKNKDSLVYITYEENGTPIPNYISSFAYKDEEYVYIDATLLTPGTQISIPDSGQTVPVEQIKEVKGVYNVNEGYCRFTHVEIIYENQEYCIVKKNNEYGLSVYDHIVINPETINEDDIIY
ncbi:MAG: hypothetical protein E7270_12120 [Lachnospiraceae bacterium]|nr:hypothetical protein [Lachnospiraceae bacterium]